MKFSDIVKEASALLQESGRITYRALKLEFDLDDEQLDVLKDELIEARALAVDKDGKMLVWAGAQELGEDAVGRPAEQPPVTTPVEPQPPDAERRQLTVMFCDLVGSTPLSEQLDPEELREVVAEYQQACEGVIAGFEGYVARYQGDGLLVYFGYPAAQEDAAARALRAGLGIVAAMPALNTRLHAQVPALKERPLQVRIGIHSGLVVVGEMGRGAAREQVALGETPNIAARVQGKAEPNTVVISKALYRLVKGLFRCQDLGPQDLKGIATPQALYQVLGTSEEQSHFEVAIRAGLTPLVGRAEEVGLLRKRWQQAREGEGQAVSVSGEAGIGKSRLVEELRAHVVKEGGIRIEYRCSPYHQNSALYPVIAHVEKVLEFASDDTPAAKLEKLQRTLSSYRFPQADTVPLLAALLSLPHPEDSPPITVSAQKQKEQTQAVLLAWLFEETDKTPVCCTWEDLHWADPSSLEFLSLCLDQIPTAHMLTLLTFRPEFTPPWGTHSYLNQLTLNRLGRMDVGAMVAEVTGGKSLPVEVLEQITNKTNGVPLFVEELTKMVVESDFVRAVNGHYELTGPLPPLAIPATLQDSLMARLDRLGTAKEVAQLGAALGREFSYELIQAVSPLNEATLQQALRQLVEAELIYQRGLSPQAHYLFKHALIQDTAYQSLLKSTRQHLHRQIAQVLEERFRGMVETQPELVAHHYTEAGLIAQAIPLWQQAGQRAIQRSANVEAISHLTHGLAVLQTLPDTPERSQHELSLQAALGPALMVTKGWSAPAVKAVYNRQEELCQQMGETPQLFRVWHGLWTSYFVRAEHRAGLELGERLLRLAQIAGDPALRLEAHMALMHTLWIMGEFGQAREHCEQGNALYDQAQHHALTFVYFGFDPGMGRLVMLGYVLHDQGYPDQARQRMTAAVVLAREVAHPASLAHALMNSAVLYYLRGEGRLAQEAITEQIALTTEQGLAPEGSPRIY